jgi:signal transduction histidine kinase
LALDRLDRTLGAVFAILGVTLIASLVVGAEVRIVAPGLDLVFDTVRTLVALAVAVLAWARFRDRGQRAALFQVAAFLVLALASGVAAALALVGLDSADGAAFPPFSEGALYVSTLARGAAAALLVIGGVASLRGESIGRPLVIVTAPVIALLVATALAPAWAPLLPPLVGPIDALGGGSTNPAIPDATPANVLLQAAVAALFMWAAALARRRHHQDRAPAERYLTVGLVIAAFAQLHLAFYPSAYTGVITSGDLLYLAFDIAMLLGVEAETRAYIVSLRQANLGLERLKDAEVERAAIEERARLSRELHDGLAQDLWFAKLKLGRLAAMPDLQGEARVLCGELDEAIDTGLAEARQAVMALRFTGQSDTSFGELMGRYVDDFADRFGLRAEFECAADIPRLDTRVEAELLRIAQEALSNVRRHADATVVWVTVDAERGRVTVTVRDNGRGFDPAAGGFGLASMRERATLVGGRLSITSRPRDGTRVSVDVPFPPAATAPAGTMA